MSTTCLLIGCKFFYTTINATFLTVIKMYCAIETYYYICREERRPHRSQVHLCWVAWYWKLKQQSTVNENHSLGKNYSTRKLESEMPNTFVDQQLIDISHKLDPVLAKAASSCYWSMVKSGLSSWHFFISFYITTNPLQNIVLEFWLYQNDENIIVEALINLMG